MQKTLLPTEHLTGLRTNTLYVFFKKCCDLYKDTDSETPGEIVFIIKKCKGLKSERSKSMKGFRVLRRETLEVSGGIDDILGKVNMFLWAGALLCRITLASL